MTRSICAAVVAAASLAPRLADASPIWATGVTWSVNQAVPGEDFAAFYGGTYPGSFPVPFASVAAAEAAVLGAPDTEFLSLPGAEGLFDYVEVSFGALLTADTILNLVEQGATGESAHVWVWSPGGSNFQFDVTRGAADLIQVDLRAYAASVAAIGGTIDRIGIGGRDLLGASAGFDLDAVGLEPVPEPASLFLLGTGLVLAAGRIRTRLVRMNTRR